MEIEMRRKSTICLKALPISLERVVLCGEDLRDIVSAVEVSQPTKYSAEGMPAIG